LLVELVVDQACDVGGRVASRRGWNWAVEPDAHQRGDFVDWLNALRMCSFMKALRAARALNFVLRVAAPASVANAAARVLAYC
jgi:hypothetical protein